MDTKSQLLRDEGVVLYEYKDHLGYSTIGVGRLIDQRKGGGLTHDEAMYLLDNDIKKVTRQIQERLPWTSKLSPCRFAVLVNMCFQMGINGLLGFKNTLQLIEEGQYIKAGAGMMNSLWAKQTPERAQRLANQMANDTWY